MSEPIRNNTHLPLSLGQELLAEALPDWREQPRTALALALEKASAETAADIILAAACTIVSAAVRREREAGRGAQGLALFDVELELESLSRELSEFHRARCARWERRA